MDSLQTVNLITDDYFWSAHCEGVALGDTSEAFGWATLDEVPTEIENSVYSIFDTGSPSIMLSKSYFANFIERLFEKVPE